MFWKYVLVFIGNFAGYILIYATYTFAQTELLGRIIWTSATVLGTIFGKPVGDWMFGKRP